jgi:hypothetical protein
VVLWGYHETGAPLERLPPLAAAYVESIRRALLARADHRDHPVWQVFRLGAALGRWRVAWADIARTPAAVALDELARPAIPLNTCYVAACPDRDTALTVAATLDTTWTQALLWATADEARGGYRRYNARVTGGVPIPVPSPERDRVVALSREAHLTGHVSQPDLDRAVADALGLPADVRATLAHLARDPG